MNAVCSVESKKCSNDIIDMHSTAKTNLTKDGLTEVKAIFKTNKCALNYKLISKIV